MKRFEWVAYGYERVLHCYRRLAYSPICGSNPYTAARAEKQPTRRCAKCLRALREALR